ncbi:MAG: penicillin-binding protein 2 [Candidatus Eisenbacteria bacterium]|nr:penicillin-binding protein 2 [Candidatus Eisenbacteria bacterium]
MPRRFHKEDRAHRARFLYLLIGGITLLLVGRLGELQLAKGSFYRTRSQENRIRAEVLPSDRGRILDRNGVVLADDYPSSQLTLYPRHAIFQQYPDSLEQVLAAVGEVLDRTPDELRKRLASATESRPAILARQLSFEQVSLLEERHSRLPGITVEAVPVRRYPNGGLACHLLGYLGEVGPEDLNRDPETYHAGDLIGKTGIERQYETLLRGQDGEAYVEVDVRGRRTRMFTELPVKPAVPGEDVVLTIDAELQKEMEAALADIRIHGGKDGFDQKPAPASCAVAIDPRNGEILALASYPGYDPNMFVGGLSKEEYAQLQSPGHPQQNRVIQSTYPPGSTWKVLTSLAGLHADIVGYDTMLQPCWGRYKFGDRYFRCWNRGGHGPMNHTAALRQSCDVFYYQVGEQLEVRGLSDFARGLHVQEKTGIDLPGERAGLVPTPEWYKEKYGGFGKGVALNLSIGQGEILLSPLALARFYALVANGGTFVQPHMIREVRARDGRLVRAAEREDWTRGRADIPAADLDFVHSALEEVVMHARGTGKSARVGEIRIAGKTGTAENPGEDHALFACYAPADAPTLVVVVVAEHAGHGGSVAAPAARRVLQCYFERSGDFAASLEAQP